MRKYIHERLDKYSYQLSLAPFMINAET
jgi:hypothetical protein